MTLRTVYICDLCGDCDTPVYGIEVNLTDFDEPRIKEVDLGETNTHICNKCMIAICNEFA